MYDPVASSKSLLPRPFFGDVTFDNFDPVRDVAEVFQSARAKIVQHHNVMAIFKE